MKNKDKTTLVRVSIPNYRRLKDAANEWREPMDSIIGRLLDYYQGVK